jgi:hypothetical protein
MSAWRPRNLSRGDYDFIATAERARLERKWELFQARRRGDAWWLIAQRERNLAYYDISLPQWRLERAALANVGSAS